jgi:hypothetical protein
VKEPGLRLLFEARRGLSRPLEIGDSPFGMRRVIPIEPGGRFEGTRISGQMVAGHDWQVTRADGVTEVDARYLLKTDDGVLIECRNRGLRHGPPEVMRGLASGEPVDPDAYYFRAAPTFNAPDGPYAWLNRSLFLCTGARYPDSVAVRFYEVL